MEAFSLESDRDDNEAMYAQAKVDKVDYGKEVPLTFYHLNAKIQLAFRSAIPGYTVELLNMVPEDGLVTVGEGQAAAVGVQLTPATATEAAKPVNFVITLISFYGFSHNFHSVNGWCFSQYKCCVVC